MACTGRRVLHDINMSSESKDQCTWLQVPVASPSSGKGR